jgi:hypothetical protein
MAGAWLVVLLGLAILRGTQPLASQCPCATLNIQSANTSEFTEYVCAEFS